MTLKIYFLRHGETPYSRTGGFCGALDPDLTASGVQMAQTFATAYTSTAWTAVYVSPIKRTIATAQPLCDAIPTELNHSALKVQRFLGGLKAQVNPLAP